MTVRQLHALPGPPHPAAGRRRIAVVVCDSLGIGGAPDADDYGDWGADTLANVAEAAGGLSLPTLGEWGIGRLTDVAGVPAVGNPAAVVARLTETAAGKDSTVGHWELMGVRADRPFPTYPEGFPPEVIRGFEDVIGRPVLGNRVASGTAIIDELGVEHLRTGAPIVYTSADSVFQVAAHVDEVPVDTLYRWCAAARRLLDGENRVGRVIARPFDGSPGAFRRIPGRRDFSVAPPETTACELLHSAGIAVKAVGKVEDLFVGQGITYSDHTGDNEATLAALAAFLAEEGPAFVFANLVDFDQLYGHRNDPLGYAAALERFDRQLGELATQVLQPGDRVIVTADHGTDPTRPGTDHTRERVPCLAWGPDLTAGRDLGTRATFADVGASVLDAFSLPPRLPAGGSSFAAHFLP